MCEKWEYVAAYSHLKIADPSGAWGLVPAEGGHLDILFYFLSPYLLYLHISFFYT